MACSASAETMESAEPFSRIYGLSLRSSTVGGSPDCLDGTRCAVACSKVERRTPYNAKARGSIPARLLFGAPPVKTGDGCFSKRQAPNPGISLQISDRRSGISDVNLRSPISLSPTEK